jgi:exocyst complex component 4
MSEKRLLQASVLLVRSLKTINKSDMVEIGAVADLRSYLIGQENVSSNDMSRENISQLVQLLRHCEKYW